MRKFDLRRAIIYSVALHVVLALGMAVPSLFHRKPVVPETVTVELLSTPMPEPVAAKIPRQKVDPQTKQIVEQDEKSRNDEKPIRDAFLSATNQRVEKETMAREHGAFRNAKDQKTVESKDKAGGKKAKPVAERPRLEDLLGTSPAAMLEHKEETDRRADEGEGGGAKSAEASQTNDYLKNLEAGAETMLNTREFKYYTYYSRIRRQLSQYWEPKVRDKLTKMFRQGRSIASDQDHITKLLIVLNDEGTLVRVQVLSESGVTDLDEAATEAFRSAAPFPNPPDGIVEGDGTVKIRWDFVLES